MTKRIKGIWCVIVLYGIVVGLVLTLPACGGPGCTDCLENMTFLCREGHCTNAPDHAVSGQNAQ
jgi:hypothetical protein